jgi:TetR/AcrR family transcriptional regulator, fatty acid metabolism regulator protein
LAERATAAEEKRRLILDAAARVFARKGFHTSRVGDIAEEAGVAHGLLYHYFSSKDEVLETIFREHWTNVLEQVHDAETSEGSAIERLRAITRALLGTWLAEPDVVRVVIREIARTAEIEEHVGELVKPIGAIRRVIESGQSSGELRPDLDPTLAAIVFYGGIDELISGWVLGRLPGGEHEVAAAERHVVDAFSSGLVAAGHELGKAPGADVSA